MQKTIEFLKQIMETILKFKSPSINNNEHNPITKVNGLGKVFQQPIKKEIPMYKFGKRSRQRLDTCHEDIVKIMEEVIKVYDFSVLEGLRTAEKQAEYFETGRSKLDGVHKKSKHQDDGSGKSMAIDICPYKKGYNPFSGKKDDLYRFYFMLGIVWSVTQTLIADKKITHNVRFGADWKMDMVYDTSHEFTDLPHIELVTL